MSEGEQGQRGRPGEPGETGETGETGLPGEPGTPGTPGRVGLTGDIGDQGERGIQGVQGDQGRTGVAGVQGVQGAQGEPGALREEVRLLRESLTSLHTTIDTQITSTVGDKVNAKVDERVDEVAVRRDKLRGIMLRWLAVAVFLAFLLAGVNRITLVQAQQAAEHDLSRQVTQCFLGAARNTPAQAAECGRRFGPEYTSSQQQSVKTLGVFVKLQERVKHLEDEVAALKE